MTEENSVLKHGDLYDFAEAIDEFAFDFEEFSDKNFHEFISGTYIKEFILMRRAFEKGNFEEVRGFVHKFKGLFRLFLSKSVSDICESLQNEIEKGNKMINNLYVKLVNEMLFFLKEFSKMCSKLNKPLNENLLNNFYKLNNECEKFETEKMNIIFDVPKNVRVHDEPKNLNQACCQECFVV